MQPVSRICKRLCRAERYSFRPARLCCVLRFRIGCRPRMSAAERCRVPDAIAWYPADGGTGKGSCGCGRLSAESFAAVRPVSGTSEGRSIAVRSHRRRFGTAAVGRRTDFWVGRTRREWAVFSGLAVRVQRLFCINFAEPQQRKYRYGDIACRQLRLVHLQSGAHAP